jgi:D-alanyl-D-alanine carboxypeptidase
MRIRAGWVFVVALVLGLAACGSDASPASTTSTAAATSTSRETETTTPESTVAPASTEPTEPAGAFPIATFAAIGEDPVTEELAAEFQSLLNDMAGDGGMAATVMTHDGTWTGATGTADGVRAIQGDDQFAIGSVTKSVVAAQVMQLVEAGDLSLDDLAAEHLPADLDFDTNQATIRHLLNHRSGLRNSAFDFIWDTLATDRQHVWTLSEVLELTGDPVRPAGQGFEYSDANYFLLGLIIEQVRGRPLAQVLRDDVLAIDGVERLVYQPDERPSDPMAMPAGESTDALELGGGYLSSMAGVTSGGPAAAIASDSPSLGRWWRAFCAGEIVSPDSLAEMKTTVGDDFGLGYGLGLFNVAGGYGPSVGHAGTDYGFASWAGCLPEQGAVVVVLANRAVDDIRGMAGPLLGALR